MTLWSSDLQSDSDLDSIRNSCDVFILTTMPWICPPAFAPVAPREDRADLVSTLSAEPSSVLQGKDFTFPGCVFVGHIFDHFLFRWRLRRLCLARILTSKKTFRSNNSTSNVNKLPLYTEVIQLSRSTNLPWKKLPGKDRGLKFPRLSGRIFYLTISLKSQKTKLIW